jgi:hypothetical protein
MNDEMKLTSENYHEVILRKLSEAGFKPTFDINPISGTKYILVDDGGVYSILIVIPYYTMNGEPLINTRVWVNSKLVHSDTWSGDDDYLSVDEIIANLVNDSIGCIDLVHAILAHIEQMRDICKRTGFNLSDFIN